MSSKYLCSSCNYSTSVYNSYKIHLNSKSHISKILVSSQEKHNVIIAGTARNVEKFLKGTLKTIDDLRSQFANSKVIIYEDGSTDNTVDILENWKSSTSTSDNPSSITLFVNQENSSNFRTVRLANARNHILNYIRKNKEEFFNYDYLLMIDLDNVNEHSSVAKTLSSALSNIKDYPDALVIFASNPRYYYDIWALRWYPIIDFDFVEKVRETGDNRKYLITPLNNILKKINRARLEHKLVQVESAFGGAGLYKLKYLLDPEINYIGEFKEHEICEHVLLNKSLLEKNKDKKLYIDPNWWVDNH